MSYKEWVDEHAKKHAKIIQKLLALNYSKEEIIEYFDYDNMKVYEKWFCPLYQTNQKCHDTRDLNCYFCACPNFRFSDDGIRRDNDLVTYSECSIKSADGRQVEFDGKIHQDCSLCAIPHQKEYIRQMFNTSWKSVMLKCEMCGSQI